MASSIPSAWVLGICAQRNGALKTSCNRKRASSSGGEYAVMGGLGSPFRGHSGVSSSLARVGRLSVTDRLDRLESR